MKTPTIPAALAVTFASLTVGQTVAAPAHKAVPVIEVATMKLKPGVTVAQFSAADADVGANYIAKRQGYISRESAPGKDGAWLVIVHWRSLADADASMKSFEAAPQAARFMSLQVPNSMVMTRYSR